MISPIRRIIGLILVFFVLNTASITKSNDNPDILTVSKNITDGLLNGTLGQTISSDIKDAEGILALTAEDENGYLYFTDIDYSNEDRVSWLPSKHIGRMERLAILYRLESDADKKEELKTNILRLLDYWLDNDFQSTNWWHNRLSAPNALGEFGILMKDDLNKKQTRLLAEKIGRGCFTVSPVLYSHAGANAVDLSMSSIKFGAFAGSPAAIKEAVRIISGELDYSDDQGLKDDGTFFQHGKRIYMGGYGIEFISGMSTVIRILSGTDYIFSKEQLTPLANFICDGMRSMSFGDTLDPTTMGRSTSRKNAQPLRGIISTLEMLAAVEEMPRKDEIKAYADSIRNDEKSDFGIRYFDNAKMLVVNNSNFYFSFRGGADYLAYSEIINDENVLAYNSSFPGVTTIMSNGDEYYNIAPVYNYSFVPGTTAVNETDEELFAHSDFTYRYLSGTYGATVADGAAVSLAKTKHEGISMTVSCFATDDAVILMGAGMNDSKGRKMNTTLDQSFYAGSFERDGNTVIHNGIKYTVLEGGALTAENEHRTGDWHRNNLPYASSPAEGDIFTISIENTGSYAYTVMSENTDAEFEIIVNSENVQAVRLPDGRVAAAFFEKTEFTYAGRTYKGNAGEAIIAE